MHFKVKDAREQKKMSQEELSKKAGVSRAIISGLESGRTVTTTTDTIEKIAKALDMPVSAIFLD